jgi:hypothetical protein
MDATDKRWLDRWIRAANNEFDQDEVEHDVIEDHDEEDLVVPPATNWEEVGVRQPDLVLNAADEDGDLYYPPTINWAAEGRHEPHFCVVNESAGAHGDDELYRPPTINWAAEVASRQGGARKQSQEATVANNDDDELYTMPTINWSKQADPSADNYSGVPAQRMECSNCNGTGRVGTDVDPGNRSMTCETCHGSGFVTLRRNQPT